MALCFNVLCFPAFVCLVLFVCVLLLQQRPLSSAGVVLLSVISHHRHHPLLLLLLSSFFCFFFFCFFFFFFFFLFLFIAHDEPTTSPRYGDGDSKVGTRIILPPSFTGGPRYMHARFQDAMAIVRNLGKPDFFITITCNPQWPEIADLPAGVHPGVFNRPRSNELAMLISTDNHVTSRDIVIRSHSTNGAADDVQRISELHPLYDCAAYPLILPEVYFSSETPYSGRARRLSVWSYIVRNCRKSKVKRGIELEFEFGFELSGANGAA